MNRYSGRSRRGSQRGAAVIELALVLPILVMLVFGIFSAGLTYNDHLSLTNAVREGGRLGAAIDYSANGTGWANDVRSRVQQTYFNGSSSLSDAQVCVALVSSAGTKLAQAAPQGTSCGNEPPTGTIPTGTCVVKVWTAKPRTIELIVFPIKRLTITAQSVSYYGREAGSCLTQ